MLNFGKKIHVSQKGREMIDVVVAHWNCFATTP